jgi:predicted nucleotidyltransferase
VNIKVYGSSASGLAIESSDVDLAVVGLDFKGSRDYQIQEMRRLLEQLDKFMQSKSSLKFIDSATVPVIKLSIDLLKISKTLAKKVGEPINNIEEDIRFLGIDITFDDSFSKQP